MYSCLYVHKRHHKCHAATRKKNETLSIIRLAICNSKILLELVTRCTILLPRGNIEAYYVGTTCLMRFGDDGDGVLANRLFLIFLMNFHTITCILVNDVGIDIMPLLSSHVPSSVMPVITCQLTYCAKVVHTTNLPSASSGICSYPRALA